jgi:hypothetical protein
LREFGLICWSGIFWMSKGALMAFFELGIPLLREPSGSFSHKVKATSHCAIASCACS